MPTPREDLIRLLIEIDQQLAELRETVEAYIKSDEAIVALNRMVLMEAARLIVEEKLKVGEMPEQPTWEHVLEICRLSKTWPNG